MDASNIGAIGRISRILLGGFLFLLALPYYLFPGVTVTFLSDTYSSNYASVLLAYAISFGFLTFYLLLHRASTTYLQNLSRWKGAALANVPPQAIFIASGFFGLGSAQIAVFTYVGLAMVLAGLRKDPGLRGDGAGQRPPEKTDSFRLHRVFTN